MFCDDLVTDTKLLKSYDSLDKVFARIHKAKKFILTKDFAQAADGLVENMVELCKITPYCRLPYPITWIEWLHDDRPHWNPEGPYTARPVDPNRHQMAPQHVGLLLEQQYDFAGCWKAHLFWSLKTKPAPEESQFNGSLGAVVLDTRKLMALAEDPNYVPGTGLEETLESRILADFGRSFLNKVTAKAPDIASRLMEYAIEDWGGEIRFMIAVLGLLNTRNVAQFNFVDKKLHNIKRAKQGKRPLFSHTTLKIRPQMLRHADSDGGIAGDRNLRLHFVRGHFKHRKTGLFYWSHHARGSRELGEIEKDYEVS